VWALAAAAILVASPGFAQPSAISEQFIRRSWGTNEGLPQNSITAMVQTRDGYLWLGTFGGLVRFDGHAFTVFLPGNTPGLASSRITTLLEDRRGALWIGTEAGLTRYEGGRFVSFYVKDGLNADGIIALAEDREGTLWVAMSGAGMCRFNGKTFDRVDFDKHVLSLAVTPDGDVWAGGLDIFRFRHGRLTEVYPGDGETVRGLHVDPAGHVWAGAGSLRKWDGARFVEIPMPLTGRERGGIRAITSDSSGHVWIATPQAGLFRLRNGTFDRYTSADGLGGDFVRSLAIDRDGNHWIGTDVGGLVRLRRRSVFSHQRPGSSIQSIAPIVGDGDGGVWIGGVCGGLLHFRDGVFRVYSERDGLPHGCVWGLHRDPDGTVWVGTAGAGVFRFRDGTFTRFGKDVGLADVSNVSSITRDRDGALWVGRSDDLARLENGQARIYGRPAGVPTGIATIFQDRDGALWIGTGSSGLHRFEHERVTRSYTTAQGLSSNYVRAIHQDADGVLWLGTYGGGLNRFKDGRFTPILEKDGLHDSAVSRIIEDERGNFWMSGNKGIFRVARSQLNDFADGRITYITSVSYGVADGMIIDETNGGSPAGWRTEDGRLWFPTIKGLVEIRPESGAAPTPPVYVERAVVDGRPVDTSALASLGPGRVDAEFHFTAVDLGGAEKTRFRYRLDGYDAEGHWTDSGARRVAYYTNIPPGSYRFEVIATNRDGQWTDAPARVALAVTPLLWQRREVQAAGLLLLLVLTGFLVREVSVRRARARVKELEREQAVERERSRIARDLHDDLGSRLAQIALISEDREEPRAAEQISGVAREAMQTLDELVWTVNARNDTVGRFAEFAAEFAQEHLRLAGLRCRLQLPDDLDGQHLAADTRRHLYLAFKEAVHNVVKHAKASEARVALTVEGSLLALEVADNGRGLPPDLDVNGNGLLNMRERMEAVGGTLAVNSPPPASGTRLVFRVPLMAGLGAQN
jgi:ligand-binding sensor domain-containing protein/signal transduction histidine kinase